MILDRLQMIAGAIAGGLAVLLLSQLYLHSYAIPAARNEGREMERAFALKKSIELIQKRSKTNAEVRDLSAGGLCVALGGKFVDGVCQ
jgi:hypothetical protein